VGRAALTQQHAVYQKIIARDYSNLKVLPRLIKTVAVAGQGVAREGAKVFKNGQHVGYVTSGTRVPFLGVVRASGGWPQPPPTGATCAPSGLAYLNSDILNGDKLAIRNPR